MLEVVIALLIFTLGFFGLASLQRVAMGLSHEAVLQNTAVELADSLLTQTRVEGNSVDLQAWQKLVADRLPEGHGQLLKNNPDWQIHIEWQSPGQPVSSMQHYQLSFRQTD